MNDVKILKAGSLNEGAPTLENLDAFLAKVKAENPIRFAEDEARGDFEKLRLSLGGKPKKESHEIKHEDEKKSK